jgi:DNA polymerase II small subunit
MENGFFLDKSMLEFFCELERGKFLDVVLKLKELGISEKILSKDVFGKYKDKIGYLGGSGELMSEVKILRDIKGNSGKVEAGDFVSYFRARFEAIRDILIKKDLTNLSSIRRIGLDNGVFCVVGMVFSKRITKNKNLLIEIEDLTGRTIVLVNRDNKELFDRAQGLLLDDVVGFKVSGSSKMLFANDFIYPDAGLEREVCGDKDEFVAFSGDFHVGSSKFLEGNLTKFVDWLNGDVGDLRQKSLARKVKYLVLSGDNIDGVGVYPGQEKSLKIKGCRGQYEKLAEILGRIRKDIEIVMCPGQHDAVWVGEPQPAISEKWGGSLNKMENLRMVSNPSMVEVGGLKILVYYGGSLNKFIDEIGGFRAKYGHRVPTRVVEEILKRRHLAPVYGGMDIIPNKVGDDLVLGDLPDVFVVGGQHRAMVNSYNNILIVSSSCWQSRTDFEALGGHDSGEPDKVGSGPDHCKVPILNLKSREIKILDFSDDVVELEEGK